MYIRLKSTLIFPAALSFVFLLLFSQLHAEDTPSRPLDSTVLTVCDFQKVARVIDGDTFDLSDGTRIRLIGVDTPEVVDFRKDTRWYGMEASKKLREWIENTPVCLREDRDKTRGTGKYGRSLRYVWKYGPKGPGSAPKGFFVNAELIKQGYGFAYTKYPFQFLEEFRGYERTARENKRGLWDKTEQKKWEKKIEKNRVLAGTCSKEETICPGKAMHYIGQHKTVRFFVKKSYNSGKAVFLNSKNDFRDHDNFTAVIFKRDWKKFTSHASDFYKGKAVDVTGRIKEYNGRAEIILKHRDQIRIVSSDP
ncbi:MAG TPA: thermonuclease family protein [Nitrospirae bacterium]|nr:thermonuclease precursor [bacterium BMS3Abin10]GBE40075.1 thermonuclease precursor [bacterium BMS3Bbin08]HDH50691.1 thermonuclease family protein [Nitrospirota bacterium]HDK17739.1 thermonuclease family protein [Nitrospirota bacterium]HDO25080.1 thermonuclease family protein [Nitrospirota bacterium]